MEDTAVMADTTFLANTAVIADIASKADTATEFTANDSKNNGTETEILMIDKCIAVLTIKI